MKETYIRRQTVAIVSRQGPWIGFVVLHSKGILREVESYHSETYIIVTGIRVTIGAHTLLTIIHCNSHFHTVVRVEPLGVVIHLLGQDCHPPHEFPCLIEVDEVIRLPYGISFRR